jgi:hypothetical protein
MCSLLSITSSHGIYWINFAGYDVTLDKMLMYVFCIIFNLLSLDAVMYRTIHYAILGANLVLGLSETIMSQLEKYD